MIDGRSWWRRIWVGIAAGAVLACSLLRVPLAAASEASPIPERLLPLARELEVQFHVSYDSAPPVYRQRIQYTLDVFEAWRRSGRTQRDEALLEGWLHDAMERSLPGGRVRLGPIPEFSDSSQVASSGVGSVSEAGEVGQPGKAPRVESAPPRAATEPDRPSRLPPAPGAPARENSRHSNARPEPARIRVPPRRPADVPVAAESPAATEAPALPEVSGPAPTIRTEPAPSADVAPHQPLATRSPGETRQIPGATGAVASEVARPLDSADESRVAGMARSRPGVPLAAPVAADLNLNEYAARLVGHRLGVRRLEARMLELKAPTTEQLANLVGELETLHNQASLLAMYARLLPDEMQGAYGRPVSAADAVGMLSDMIHGRRTLLAAEARPASAAGWDREGAQLITLAEKLAHIAAVGSSQDAAGDR
jgi:hypothetical protein